MGDEYTLYEDGISRLLTALGEKNNQQLYQHVLLMQMELVHNITKARKYGSSATQQADLHRILEQLIEVCLLATGKSFYEWCQVGLSEKQEPRDLSDLQRAGLAQDLLEAFVESGARTRKDVDLSNEDLLERYASVPLHAIFLYTSEDEAIPSYILNNWDALDSLSGTICDIHPLLEQFQSFANAYEYIRKIDVIKHVPFNSFSQLPGMFFWNHVGETAYLSFGVEAKPVQIKNILRVVFEELYREPTLASVNRAKQILNPPQNVVAPMQKNIENKSMSQKRLLAEPTRQATDIGIIIALEEEFNVFFPTIAKIQCPESDPEHGLSFYRFAVSTKASAIQSYHCVSSLLGRMGPTTAMAVTQRMIDLYHPHTIVVLGIAASIHSDVRLGDVIVADSVDSYIERGKINEQVNAFPLALSGQVYQCSGDLLHRLHSFKYQHQLVYEQWRRSSTRFWQKCLAKSPQSSLMPMGDLQLPVTYIIGPLASGPLVVASSSFKELLLQRNRSLLGIEMEASGVLAVLNQTTNQRRVLVLRGVSDFGDERKTDLDRIQDGVLRQFAMYNAVQLFWKLLETGVFPRTAPTE